MGILQANDVFKTENAARLVGFRGVLHMLIRLARG